MNLSERVERALLQYFARDADDEREFQSLSSVHLAFEPPLEWREYHWSDVDAFYDKENLKAILDQMVMDGLLQVDWANAEIEPSYRVTEQGAYEAVFGLDRYVPSEPTIEPIEVDAIDWTGSRLIYLDNAKWTEVKLAARDIQEATRRINFESFED